MPGESIQTIRFGPLATTTQDRDPRQRPRKKRKPKARVSSAMQRMVR